MIDYSPDPYPTVPCPVDGTPVARSERYPEAVCELCIARATDEYQRPINIHNATLFGGFAARHTDDKSPCDSVTRTGTIFIDGVGFSAQEARFGGVVVQPLRFKY